MKMQNLRGLACAVLLGSALSGAWASVEVSGVTLDDTVTVGGTPLTLNGAGFRKRGYFKVDVTALYTTQRVNSVEALEKLPGAKRLELIIQQDLSGSQASRYFLIDFEASATPAEFAQLINEVSQIGGIYSALPKIKKGDIVAIDVIPGKGAMASLNGTPLVPHGATSPFFNNDLLAKIFLRMYIAGKTPAELHDNLLGLSTSMREKSSSTPAATDASAKAASAH